MVPRVAQRGHSFKSAGLYYLHDKQADTSERVAWTHTLNLPTDDAEKAMKWMAFTAKNADYLKQEAGVKSTGRKASSGCVYSYSLAWHPDESPEKDYMKLKALETLELLGLKEHEAVFVAHNETDHDHVHVIVNLIHPETGKTAVVYKDQYLLSTWAENYEKEKGQVYCEERVLNNERRQGRGDKEKLSKHKEEQLERARLFHDMYVSSDSGQAFRAALLDKGYHLAAGDRRDYVIIDESGRHHSLSRHLNLVIDKENNQNWRNDYRERLKDLELENSKELAAKLQQKTILESRNENTERGDLTKEFEENKSFKTEQSKTPVENIINPDDIIIPEKYKESYLFLERVDSESIEKNNKEEENKKTIEETAKEELVQRILNKRSKNKDIDKGFNF